MKKVSINFWDDFYEDECIPEGCIQETYAYIEGSNITIDEEQKVLEFLRDQIIENDLLPETVSVGTIYFDSRVKFTIEQVKKCISLYGNGFFYSRWQIVLKNITHKDLDKLVKVLQKNKPKYLNKFELEIYSES